MFSFFNKNKNTTNDNSISETNVEEKCEEKNKTNNTIKNEEKEEWIWIEGYKGTGKDMKCRDFQYELNKNFKYDDNVKLCLSGFHFCEDLKDVFSYYMLGTGARFFKVKGLVNKKEYDFRKENEKNSYRLTCFGYNDSKFVAKEIIFLEELTYKNKLKRFIKQYMPMIENETEYENCNNYNEFCKGKFLSEMKILGFSDLFSQIQYDKIASYNYQHVNLIKYLRQAKAYKEENISKDLMIYLLEKMGDK